jgi:choice-of-anchor B domain-containing protein
MRDKAVAMSVAFRRSSAIVLLLALCAIVIALTAPLWPVLAHPGHGGGGGGESVPAAPLGPTPCIDGSAGGYPCARIDLESFVPTSLIGGGRTNDIWGWTDPLTGREYALVGRTTGTSFVDLSDPGAPVYLGNLPTHSQSSTWRGIKVYNDHAFIISEAAGHGLQVFDLTQLRSVTNPPVTFTATAHYAGFARAHTVAINEETGFLYAVGSNTCMGGLHMVDVRTPAAPLFAGCFSADRYTHETQCVVYRGPDARYVGREICFNANEDTLTIVDVTDKAAPAMLVRKTYPARGYTHQGWLTEDHRHFLLDDETDEAKLKTNTRTHVFDVSDLLTPQVVGVHEGATTAIDHNQYVRGGHVFQSNYASGLRVLDLGGVENAVLREIGFFDVRPEDDRPDYLGTWSNFPFFESGLVIASSIERGVFVLRPNLSPVTGADLVVSQLSAGAVTGAGLPFAVTDTTRNLGASPAAASHTEFYLSTDGLFDATDSFLGERHVLALGAGAADAGDTTLVIPSETTSGSYYIVAVADRHQAAAEEIDNNNVRPRFVNIGPDLTITALKAPANAARGAHVSIMDTTTNAGGASTPSTIMRFVLSKNTKVDGDEVELGTHIVPPLDPGRNLAATTSVVIPTTTVPGIYHIIAIADLNDEVDEFAETNNIKTRKITIQ